MKEKIISGICIILMLIVILVTFSGCGKTLSIEERDNIAVQKFEEIYGEDFTIVKSGIGSRGDVYGKGSNTELTLRCEKYPDKDIRVRYRYDSKSKEITWFGTNYNCIRYEEKILEKLKFLDGIYQGYMIDITGGLSSTSNCSFEEYIQDKYSDITLFLYLPPSADEEKKDEDIENVRVLLEKNKINISIQIFYIKNDEFFNKIAEDKEYLRSYKYKDNYLVGNFAIDENYKWTEYSHWNE